MSENLSIHPLGDEVDAAQLIVSEDRHKWPLRVQQNNSDRSAKVLLSDSEGRALLRLLQSRYAIEALGAIDG